MDQLNTCEYYVRRVRSSRELEQRAANPAIAAIHQEFASRYEAILADMGRNVEVIPQNAYVA